MFHTLGLSLVGLLLVATSLPASASHTKTTSLIKEVYQKLRFELHEIDELNRKVPELNRNSFLGTEALNSILHLPTQEKVEVARTLAYDSNKPFRLLGLYVLCETGHEDEIMPELSRL